MIPPRRVLWVAPLILPGAQKRRVSRHISPQRPSCPLTFHQGRLENPVSKGWQQHFPAPASCPVAGQAVPGGEKTALREEKPEEDPRMPGDSPLSNWELPRALHANTVLDASGMGGPQVTLPRRENCELPNQSGATWSSHFSASTKGTMIKAAFAF